MILMGPFQLRISYDSKTLICQGHGTPTNPLHPSEAPMKVPNRLFPIAVTSVLPLN